MATNLEEEIYSVNAIYDSEVLIKTTTAHVLLNAPGSLVSLRINVPLDYPDAMPTVDGPEGSSVALPKGHARSFADDAQILLKSIFKTGEPCFFDLVEELKERYSPARSFVKEPEPDAGQTQNSTAQCDGGDSIGSLGEMTSPDWMLSDVITEKKSVFIARAVRVTHPTMAKAYVQHLLSTDKKAAKATHNITAWRIKDAQEGVSYNDCDDDGETAAGSRLLHLLELMGVENVMVLVTRWYGGVQLGPDRFRIINKVARDAIVKAGLLDRAHQASDGEARKKG